MSSDRPIGSLRRQTPAMLAGRVAWALHELGEPRAVTIDPQGRVWIERPEVAAEIDMMGVYDPAAGWIPLGRLLREDFIHARDAMPPEHRRVVISQQERARRARGKAV